MKSTIYILFLCCFSYVLGQAQDISLQQAKSYGQAAFQMYATSGSSKKQVTVQDHFAKKHNKQVSYYVLNMKPSGYVVLSADDDYHAVLAFSEEGHIDFADSDVNVGFWGELSRHEQNIAYVREQHILLNPKVKSEWSALSAIANGATPKKKLSFNAIVSPLVTTRWNQSGFYNESCPQDTLGPNGNTYCGCVPIAVSQLMKYFENDAPGNGSKSYTDPIYGDLSVELCGQQFDWAAMPDTLSESNVVLADFIFDVGKSMETNYSTSYTGTFSYKVKEVLVYNYGFDNDIKTYSGTNAELYSQTLRNEFENNRVVFLSAWSVDSLYNADIGHTWLADGYGYSDTGAEYMHFNWGWGGSNNGWFLDTEGFWVPQEDNKEQVNISYYWYRNTVYNIFPSGEDCQSPNPAVTTVEPEESYAWMYYRSPIDESIQFRYKEKGTEEWTTNVATTDFYSLAKNLKKGTTYEYQAARNCCGEWSSFSEVAEFSTSGPEPDIDPDDISECAAEEAEGLFTSSISDHFAYIYTSRPHGQVSNQFRYKLLNEADWNEGGFNDTHYYALTGLASGRSYEFQVRHECSAAVWSEYSSSQNFMTTGELADEEVDENSEVEAEEEENVDEETSEEEMMSSTCPQIPTGSFTAGYETSTTVSVYFLSATQGSSFRWRYRTSGSEDEWSETEESIYTSANLTGLTSATEYEYQVSQKCVDGWSEYSESNYVTSNTFHSEATELRSNFNQLLNFEKIEAALFPNPTTELLMLELVNPDRRTIQSIEIIDLSGQIIEVNQIDRSQRVQMDVRHLAEGMYHFRVVLDDGDSLLQRFVKL